MTIGLWKLFADDLDLRESKQQHFNSLHDCFIRELKEGARVVDADQDVVVSPCDAIVGAFGRVNDTELFQAKGFPYTLQELLKDTELVERHRDGYFVTLRLKSTMYHRFHAPYDGSINRVNYIAGDTWNVNPIALKRIEKLYCENERVVLSIDMDQRQESLTLVPVAAILVASIKLNFLDHLLDLKYQGPDQIACHATFKKGGELGYFQHGSTIIVFMSGGVSFCKNVKGGEVIRMGESLFRFDNPVNNA